jgi:hypothetical protein
LDYDGREISNFGYAYVKDNTFLNYYIEINTSGKQFVDYTPTIVKSQINDCRAYLRMPDLEEILFIDYIIDPVNKSQSSFGCVVFNLSDTGGPIAILDSKGDVAGFCDKKNSQFSLPTYFLSFPGEYSYNYKKGKKGTFTIKKGDFYTIEIN